MGFFFRYLYRRNKKGITAKLDDDLLKFYCNEDTFLMQVRYCFTLIYNIKAKLLIFFN